MPTNEELARRLDHLEREVEHLRSDQAITRAMSAMTDRDLTDIHAKLDAHTKSLNALHQTQVEQGKVLADHGRVLADHGERLGRVEGRLERIEGSLGGLTVGMHTIEGLLRRLTDAPDGD